MPYTSSILGFVFGFGFGVGCALAVLYSIFLHGYRAALRDSTALDPPERLLRERRRLDATKSSATSPDS